MSFLELKDVSHCFFTKKNIHSILSHIHLTVEQGEFISIVGPSGCGKTTILSLMSGLLSPTEGELFLDTKVLELQKNKIGYMLQVDGLFPWKNIRDNILMGLSTQKRLTDQSIAHALSLLKEMGLEGTENYFPSQLSGGMRQRAALVRTMAIEPSLLLLDEPFSALDYQTKLSLEQLILKTLKSLNQTTVLVTHDIGEAISMSDRIFMMAPNPGRIIHIFDVPKILRDLQPMETRQHPSYLPLFQQIWKELTNHESILHDQTVSPISAQSEKRT
jgi:NitT/TauT family transport system ATP-binding protein